MSWLIVTHKTADGYVRELVRSEEFRVVVAGGFYSNLARKDGDVVEVRRAGAGEDGYGWVRLFADRVEEWAEAGKR